MLFSERTEVQCSRCGAHLEGTDVELGARNVDAASWHVVAVYDVDCGPDSVPETPLDDSVLASARLGMLADVLDQSHTPALLNVEIVEHGSGADCRIESERPHRPVIRYRRSRADVRERVRRGCWRRLDSR